MVVLDIAIVNVALPSIQTDLGFSQANLQWVVSAYALLFGGFLLLGGRIADLVGRRRVFVVGLVVFTARLVNGSLEASLGAAEDADLVVEVDINTFFALTGGELEPREAVKRGRARVQGKLDALDRCFRVLTLAPRALAA